MKQVTLDSAGSLNLGPASLYTILKRLLETGLIVQGSEKTDAEYGDQRRRYYRLADAGVVALEEEVSRAQQFLKVTGRYHA
jgi:DNA-binding PadR family transcriptional regulator